MVYITNENKVIFRKDKETEEILCIFSYVVDADKKNLAFSISKGEHKIDYLNCKEKYATVTSKEYNPTYMRMVNNGYYELEIMKCAKRKKIIGKKNYSTKNYKNIHN